MHALDTRTIRRAYVLYAEALRLQSRSLPNYKCFRCKLLAASHPQPPFAFNAKLPCPKHYHDTKRHRKSCQWLPARK